MHSARRAPRSCRIWASVRWTWSSASTRRSTSRRASTSPTSSTAPRRSATSRSHTAEPSRLSSPLSSPRLYAPLTSSRTLSSAAQHSQQRTRSLLSDAYDLPSSIESSRFVSRLPLENHTCTRGSQLYALRLGILRQSLIKAVKCVHSVSFSVLR